MANDSLGVSNDSSYAATHTDSIRQAETGIVSAPFQPTDLIGVAVSIKGGTSVGRAFGEAIAEVAGTELISRGWSALMTYRDRQRQDDWDDSDYNEEDYY